MIKYFSLFLFLFFSLAVSSPSIDSLEAELIKYGAKGLLVEEDKQGKVYTANNTTITKTTAIDTLLVDSTTRKDSTKNVTEDTTTTVATTETVIDSQEQHRLDSLEQLLSGNDVEVEQINASSVVDDYKSPRRALIISLLVPGTGQAYIRKGWRSAMYLSLEVAGIVGIVKFNKTGDEIKAQSEDFADKNYSEEKNRQFLDDLTAYGVSNPLYGGSIISVEQAIYGGAYYSDSMLTATEKYLNDLNSNKYSKVTDPLSVQGWNDATPTYNSTATSTQPFYNVEGTGYTIDSSFLTISGADTKYGSSNNLNHYEYLVDEYEKRYAWRNTMIVALILNHVTSAIDAYISTVRYNRALINKTSYKESPISVRNQIYFSENGSLTTELGILWTF